MWLLFEFYLSTDIDNITYLVSAISHATRTCSVLMFSQEYSRKKRENCNYTLLSNFENLEWRLA